LTVLVTGGAGYLGSVLSLVLLEAGYHVRVIDNLLYGGRGLLPVMGHSRFEFYAADILDHDAVERATGGVDAVIHLAAIVGDPACARDPTLARAVNEEGSAHVIAAARSAGVKRFVFTSTCSNYGRMADVSVLATEAHDLRPLSLYAETKVAIERGLLALPQSPTAFTVLRLATLFGLSPRMRFDLTVNQFVMEMSVRRKVTVYGEQFWRPYVHVRDATRAIVAVLAAPGDSVAGRVFNVGHTDENYRKVDLIEIISRRVPGAEVEFVSMAEDPRDYRVSFDRIRSVLAYSTTRSVADGVEEMATALEAGVLGGVDDPAFSNTPGGAGVTSTAVSRQVVCAL